MHRDASNPRFLRIVDDGETVFEGDRKGDEYSFVTMVQRVSCGLRSITVMVCVKTEELHMYSMLCSAFEQELERLPQGPDTQVRHVEERNTC